MIYSLQSYGKDKRVHNFAAVMDDIPQRELKIQNTTFITDYIKILDIEEDRKEEKNWRNRAMLMKQPKENGW